MRSALIQSFISTCSTGHTHVGSPWLVATTRGWRNGLRFTLGRLPGVRLLGVTRCKTRSYCDFARTAYANIPLKQPKGWVPTSTPRAGHAPREASPPHPKSSSRAGAPHPKSSPLKIYVDHILFYNHDFFSFIDKKPLCANE